jgi:hypothetical protein
MQTGLSSVDIAGGSVQTFKDDAAQEFAALGQYLFYIAVDRSSRVLTAYDTISGKSYKLADVTTEMADEAAYVSLRATQYNAYMNIENADGTFILDRITIEGGKGKLATVTK